MVQVRVTLVGGTELAKRLAEAGPAVLPALSQALYEEGQLMFAESQRQVPRRFGVLAGSGVLKPPESSGEGIAVVMGYGGAASAYALVQHENLSYHHKKGNAKFLEIPVLQGIPRLNSNLAQRIERILAGRS